MLYVYYGLFVLVCIGLVFLIHYRMFPHDDGCGKAEPTVKTKSPNFVQRFRERRKLIKEMRDGAGMLGEDGYEP